MANESSTIVQRLWNYCNVLRDDGVSYGDYIEQLTYLLFLKMADEQTKPPFNKPLTIPAEQCRRYQKRRRAVFHTKTTHQSYGRCYKTSAGCDYLRPCL